jgi:hypothetical protein
MNRQQFTAAVLLAPILLGWKHVAAAGLSELDASSGVRTALERGATSAVALLSKPGGYLDNPKVRIPLPGYLEDGAKILRALGQREKVDELVTAMNRAAEAAAPQAQGLLIDAAKKMSVEDALEIVRGSETSVTDFFARKTRGPLSKTFLPVVTQATDKVSLAQKYNAVAGKATGLGLVKKEDATIEQYVTRKSLDGLYFMIGEEEKKIRKDPIGTGSDILKKVFGRG